MEEKFRVPIRLSEKEALIMSLLLSEGNREKYGLEMVNESSGELKRGTIYVTLGRLERDRLVESREQVAPPGETGPQRRVYKATGAGEMAFRAHRNWLAAFSTAGADAKITV